MAPSENQVAKVLAIIPARGGSKAIPQKNVQVVGGKPLLSHSIEHAKNSPSITRIVVSTDDTQIGQVAIDCGAEVIWRPAEISGDLATSESALVHVLDSLDQNEGYVPDLIVFLQATAPVRHPQDIERALTNFQESGADSLLSVMRFHLFIWQEQNDGFVTPMDYDPRHRPRRQDRQSEFMENGSFYIFKPWVLREFNSRLGGKMAVHEMDEWCSLDINGPRDLLLAEWLLANYKAQD